MGAGEASWLPAFVPVIHLGQEADMRKAFVLALVILGGALSGGCYVMQDASGQWWACEDYQTPNGVATGCHPIDPPL